MPKYNTWVHTKTSLPEDVFTGQVGEAIPESSQLSGLNS